MKKLFVAAMIFTTMLCACSKKPAADAAPAPAADAAPAPAADAAPTPAADAAPAQNAAPNEKPAADNGESEREAAEFEGTKLQIAPNGPTFNFTMNEDTLSIMRSDTPDQKAITMDYAGKIIVDDFNFDGVKDIAVYTAAADADQYKLLFWDNNSQQFNQFDIVTFTNIKLNPKEKTFIITPMTHFYGDGPDGCEIQYTYDGKKLAKKTSTPRSDAIQITIDKKDMKEFDHLDSLTTEFRNVGNDVESSILDCRSPKTLIHIKDATIENVIKKDLNNDGIIDLQFHSKSNPSKLKDVIWETNMNMFMDQDEDEAEG